MEVVMALFDLLPVILCFIALLKLQICLYNKMNKYSFALLAAGTIMVLTAGTLKAIWKIIYYGFGVDFYRLNYLMFPIQAIGFILAFLGILFMLVVKKKINNTNLMCGIFLSKVIPDEGTTLANDTMIYVAMQILGFAGIFGCIAYMAKRMKKPLVILFTVFSFICILGMGYLSSKISSSSGSEYIMYNWIAESVNTLGQSFLLVAIVLLEKAGLKDFQF